MCWAISATEALGDNGTAAAVVVVVGVDVPVVVVLGVDETAAALGEVACWRFGAILSFSLNCALRGILMGWICSCKCSIGFRVGSVVLEV